MQSTLWECDGPDGLSTIRLGPARSVHTHEIGSIAAVSLFTGCVVGRDGEPATLYRLLTREPDSIGTIPMRATSVGSR